MRLGSRPRAAACLAVVLLFVLIAPALAAGNDNNIEWNGLGHAPGLQLCDDAARQYRAPENPRADQAVDVRATAYPLDLTAVNVWYTANVTAAAQSDWTALSAAYEAGDVVCSRGAVAPWKASIPATGSRVWYKIEYIDGTPAGPSTSSPQSRRASRRSPMAEPSTWRRGRMPKALFSAAA